MKYDRKYRYYLKKREIRHALNNFAWVKMIAETRLRLFEVERRIELLHERNKLIDEMEARFKNEM